MENVLVPALVAAFVTLLIEYVAKPSLDARKDRILERHRDRRAVLRAFSGLYYRLGELSFVAETGRFPDRGNDVRAYLREAVEPFDAAFSQCGLALTKLEREAFVRLVPALISLRDRETDEDFDRFAVDWVIPLAHIAHDASNTSRWRRRRATQLWSRLVLLDVQQARHQRSLWDDARHGEEVS